MKTLFTLLIPLFLSLTGYAQSNSPIIYKASCASGSYVLPIQTCLANASGSVTGVTASAPLASSGGATPNLTCTTATNSVGGCLTAAAQTIGGAKTFGSQALFAAGIDVILGNTLLDNGQISTNGSGTLTAQIVNANTVTINSGNFNDVNFTLLNGDTINNGEGDSVLDLTNQGNNDGILFAFGGYNTPGTVHGDSDITSNTMVQAPMGSFDSIADQGGNVTMDNTNQGLGNSEPWFPNGVHTSLIDFPFADGGSSYGQFNFTNNAGVNKVTFGVLESSGGSNLPGFWFIYSTSAGNVIQVDMTGTGHFCIMCGTTSYQLDVAHDGTIRAQTSVTTPVFISTAAQTTVNCSTSGNVVFSEPDQGSSRKEVIAYAAACLGTASYTFPVAFAHTPVVLTSSGPAASVVTSLSTSAMTITGATTTGFIFIKGF